MYKMTKFTDPNESMLTCYSKHRITYRSWLDKEQRRLMKNRKGSIIRTNKKNYIALFVLAPAPNFTIETNKSAKFKKVERFYA